MIIIILIASAKHNSYCNVKYMYFHHTHQYYYRTYTSLLTLALKSNNMQPLAIKISLSNTI